MLGDAVELDERDVLAARHAVQVRVDHPDGADRRVRQLRRMPRELVLNHHPSLTAAAGATGSYAFARKPSKSAKAAARAATRAAGVAAISAAPSPSPSARSRSVSALRPAQDDLGRALRVELHAEVAPVPERLDRGGRAGELDRARGQREAVVVPGEPGPGGDRAPARRSRSPPSRARATGAVSTRAPSAAASAWPPKHRPSTGTSRADRVAQQRELAGDGRVVRVARVAVGAERGDEVVGRRVGPRARPRRCGARRRRSRARPSTRPAARAGPSRRA